LPVLLAFMICMCPRAGFPLRIKDIAEIEGVRGNKLIGYGLVVGLKGTGDKAGTSFTIQSLVNMLERMGVSVRKKDVRVKNVAAVIVTAELPPFSRAGTKLDALVSSMGDAKSLKGGTLLFTPLSAPNGKVYAVAQGPISTGGFAFSGAAGGGVQVNHPTVGRVVGGVLIEKEIPHHFNEKKEITIALHSPDFTTVSRLVAVINRGLHEPVAKALDAGTVKVRVPVAFQSRLSELIASIERMDVVPDTSAKVVMDERTGTVVIGENVRISRVAVSHGNLSIVIKERPRVWQPKEFSPPALDGGGGFTTKDGVTLAPGGQTVVTPDSEVRVEEEKAHLMLVPESVSIGDLVRALNALGVSSRDLIAILQAIKAAGALHADLQII